MFDQIMRPSLALTDRADSHEHQWNREGVCAVCGVDAFDLVEIEAPAPSSRGRYRWRCRWFLRCENPATHLESHPVLGEVPCCDRCAAIGRE